LPKQIGSLGDLLFWDDQIVVSFLVRVPVDLISVQVMPAKRVEDDHVALY
jgi:hypothetical protein